MRFPMHVALCCRGEFPSQSVRCSVWENSPCMLHAGAGGFLLHPCHQSQSCGSGCGGRPSPWTSRTVPPSTTQGLVVVGDAILGPPVLCFGQHCSSGHMGGTFSVGSVSTWLSLLAQDWDADIFTAPGLRKEDGLSPRFICQKEGFAVI